MNGHTTRTQAGVRNKGLYKNLYQQIDLSGPGYDDMPSQAAPGANMAQQARAAGYQDIYRNIQAMRNADYRKEIKEGEITSEFSGVGGSGSHTTNTQAGLRDKGMYKHLFPRTTPVHHPYLPRTVTSMARRSGLGGFLGQAAEKTAPGLTVALGLLIVYFLFFRKPATALIEEPETEEETFVEEEFEPANRFHY